MKKTMLLTAALLAGSLSAVWAQSMTKQQALDEIARIERFNVQVDTMLRQAWEAGRTQKETVIDTPYGKVTVKFNLAEKIKETYTGNVLAMQLHTWQGVMQGNELRLNTESWRNKTPEGTKGVITHELGHHMDRRPNKRAVDFVLASNAVPEDLNEIEADAFALRHLGKFDYVLSLLNNAFSQTRYIDAVIKRASEMEREERENLNRLRNIAGLSPQAQPQNAGTARSYIDSGKAVLNNRAVSSIGSSDIFFGDRS
jgi:hypothetical protein